MKFHSLIALEQFVTEALAPDSAIVSDAEQTKCSLLLLQLETDIKKTFGVMYAISAGTALMNRHLDQLYKQCRKLSNTLYAYGGGVGLQGELRDSIQFILLELLDDLFDQYDAFSPSLEVPDLQLFVVAGELEAGQIQMLSLMKQYHIEPRLQAVIVGKISKLKEKGKATWAQLRHLQNIQRYVLEDFKGRFENGNERFCEFLQRSNFNAEAFLLYRKGELLKMLEQLDDSSKAYGQLCDLEKTFKTSYFKKNVVPYECRLPNVNEMMLRYVRAEMDCMRKKERGLVKSGKAVCMQISTESVPDAGPVVEKLSVSVSVEVLACLFRTMISTGLVTNPSNASVLRFLAKNVQTPGSVERDISLKSLENKFKQIGTSTLGNTRAVLSKMLQELDQLCA